MVVLASPTMIRRALGRLLRTPGVTLFCVVAIAIAIAATTVVYSTIQGLFTPPGAERFERVANIYAAPSFLGRDSRFSPEQVEHLRATQTSFADLAVWARVGGELAVDRVSRDTLSEAVTADYFTVLDVRPAMGRLFNASDDRADAPSVVVISHQLWRRRFNSDPSVVGRSLALNGRVFDIVGVAAEGFRGVDMPTVFATEAWIPLAMRRLVRPALPWPELHVKGRLKEGVSFSEADAEIRTIGQAVQAEQRQGSSDVTPRGWSVLPANDIRMHESVDPIADEFALSALALTFVVLLVVSTNLTNVQLARMASRRHELAVKTALGAARGRLVLEELTEILLVAVAGLALGVSLAHALNTIAIPALLASTSLDIAPARIFGQPLFVAFTAMLVVLAVAALVPALRVTTVSPRATLAQEDGVSTPRWRGRRFLIVAQVTVAIILVNIAGLAVTQMIPRLASDPGPRVVSVGLQRIAGRVAPRVFRSEDLERVRERASGPGLRSLALATGAPSDGGGRWASLATLDGMHATPVGAIAATPQVFDVAGVRIVRGRGLQPQDIRDGTAVVVLSETAAKRLLASLDVIGQSVTLDGFEAPQKTRIVIGVASDVVRLPAENLPSIYIPLDQVRTTSVLLLASAAPGTPRAEEDLQQLAMRAFPDVAVSRARFGGIAKGADIRLEVIGTLTGSLGVTTVIVAMGGLFGLLSHVVSVRRKEMGVRMVLGATKGRLLGMVLFEGLKPVALGIVLGLGGCLWLQKGLLPLFRSVMTFSWWVVGVPPIALLVVAAVAAYLPARRAASVDVAIALRHS